MQQRVICGVFIGGASRRMEGFPKALLRDARGETLLERTLRVVREAALEPVLVGRAELASNVVTIEDAEADTGPLGGLVALLAHAPRERVLAVACDMPGLTSSALRSLADDARDDAILAPRRAGRWEPLFARYDAARVLPIARARLAERRLALQGLLDAAGAAGFDAPDIVLHDVDTVLDAARAGLLRSAS